MRPRLQRRYGDRYTPAAELLWKAQHIARKRWCEQHLKAFAHLHLRGL